MKRYFWRAGMGRGFTLIELLVVVSIIALLIAILLPALAGAKQQATKAACAAKLKQLNTMTLTYLSEYDNTFPINGLLFPKPNAPPTSPFASYATPPTALQLWQPQYGALWSDISMAGPRDLVTGPCSAANAAIYVKLFVCPGDDRMRDFRSTTDTVDMPLILDNTGHVQQVPQGTIGGPCYWSYSVNAVTNSLGRFRQNFAPLGSGSGLTNQPWHDPLKTNEVLNQSDFIVFVEEDDTSIFNDEVFDPPAYNGGDKLTNRHTGQGNVAFLDGHVESFPQIQFDNVPSGGSGGANEIALKSPITRKFFPDNGAFGR